MNTGNSYKKRQLAAAIVVLLLLNACATFKPGSLQQIPLRERAQTTEQDGLRVSVAVLSRTEAAELFGANLHKRSVQPVWVEIENHTDKPFWLMLHGLDPNYFSAREAAYMNHISFGGKANRNMDNHFSDLAINPRVNPGETQSGFVFSNETIGVKEVRVRLYSNRDVRNFEFFVSIPGIVSKWDKTNLRHIVPDAELVYAENDAELLSAIQSLPCCTQREFGDSAGSPLNVVLIGGVATLKALLTAGWDETAFLPDLGTFFAASYLYGRPPDLQFIKSRPRHRSEIELRLWVSPIRYQGKVVGVGSIRRNLDADIDDAAIYLVEDLGNAGRIARFGFVGGLTPVGRDNPKKAFGIDAYWTRGNRLVLELTEAPTMLDELDIFDWDWPGKIIFSSGKQAGPATGQQP